MAVEDLPLNLYEKNVKEISSFTKSYTDSYKTVRKCTMSKILPG